jgi:hypothetical protein
MKQKNVKPKKCANVANISRKKTSLEILQMKIKGIVNEKLLTFDRDIAMEEAKKLRNNSKTYRSKYSLHSLFQKIKEMSLKGNMEKEMYQRRNEKGQFMAKQTQIPYIYNVFEGQRTLLCSFRSLMYRLLKKQKNLDQTDLNNNIGNKNPRAKGLDIFCENKVYQKQLYKMIEPLLASIVRRSEKETKLNQKYKLKVVRIFGILYEKGKYNVKIGMKAHVDSHIYVAIAASLFNEKDTKGTFFVCRNKECDDKINVPLREGFGGVILANTFHGVESVDYR